MNAKIICVQNNSYIVLNANNICIQTNIRIVLNNIIMLPAFLSQAFLPQRSQVSKHNNEPVTSNGFFKIVIVLDESGSMEPIKHKMRNSINDLITEQKQISGRPATFTLVKFNNTINRVIKNKLLTEVNNLTSDDYKPNGSTALYDAIGDTINWFRNENDVLMVIVTDGQENASTKYTKNLVKEMIDEKKEKNNWTYVYLSSDFNTFEQGNKIGLDNAKYNMSNCLRDQHAFGSFISNDLNCAVKEYRSKGTSIKSQLK